jgi:hypothetical protein
MAFQNQFTLFAIFFFFAFNFLSTTTTLASPHTVVLDIRNDLPNNGLGDLAIECNHLNISHIKVGVHYNQTFQLNEISLECYALWSTYFLSWDGFQEKRDGGHSIIYWSVRKDGFYHSFDASNYKLLEMWETE